MISRVRYVLREMWASMSRNKTLTAATVITSMHDDARLAELYGTHNLDRIDEICVSVMVDGSNLRLRAAATLGAESTRERAVGSRED